MYFLNLTIALLQFIYVISKAGEFMEESKNYFKEDKADFKMKVENVTDSSIAILTSNAIRFDVVYTTSAVGDPSYDSLLISKEHLITQGRDGNCLIEFLSPFTHYSICGRITRPNVTNVHGQLQEDCISVRTKKFNNEVKNLRLLNKNETTVEIAWDPPLGFETSDLIQYSIFRSNKSKDSTGSSDFEDLYGSSGDGPVDNYNGSDITNGKPEFLDENVLPIIDSKFYNRSFLITKERKATIPFEEEKEIATFCVMASWDAQYSNVTSCISSNDPFLLNVTLNTHSNGSVSVSWNTSSNTSFKTITAKFEYGVENCDCSKEKWTINEKIGVNNSNILFSTSELLVKSVDIYLYSTTHQSTEMFVGKTSFHKTYLDVIESVNMTSHENSIDFTWCSSSKTNTPITIRFSSNASSQSVAFENFVGCEWDYQLKNLSLFTPYKWILSTEISRERSISSGRTFIFPETNVTGIQRTSSTVCRKPTHFDGEFHTSSSSKLSRKMIFSVLLPKNSGGVLHKIKLEIKDVEEDVLVTVVYPVCADTWKACKIHSEYQFLPDKEYEIWASCANEDPFTFGLAATMHLRTDPVVPDIATDALRFVKRSWSDGGYSDTVKLSIDHENIDHAAGKIISMKAIYGLPGTLPPTTNGTIPQNEVLRRFGRSTNASDKARYNTMEIHPRTKHFILKDLVYGSDYEVFLRFYNRKAFSSSSRIRFRTSDYSGNSFAYFVVMTSIYMILSFQVAFLSTKRRMKSSIPRGINPNLYHPSENNFTFPIEKSKTTEIVKQLLEDPRAKLKEHFKMLNEIVMEFPAEAARLGNNRQKNRYIDIIPYDYCRVTLKDRPGQPSQDYINASYIHGYKCPLAFIACQGPMKNTIIDFWRMIWEKNVVVIIMTTKCNENIEKCTQYWPSKEDIHFPVGEMKVKTILESSDNDDYTIRKFQLSKNWTNRIVHQLHYTTWPDRKSPLSIESVLEMIEDAKSVGKTRRMNPPIVVHCSAGIGRTGTLIALWNLIDELEDSLATDVDILANVFRLRMMRISMVQTLSQYVFLYKCLLRIAELKSGSAKSKENSVYGQYELGLNSKMGFKRMADSNLYISEDEGLEPLTDEETDDLDGAESASPHQSKE